LAGAFLAAFFAGAFFAAAFFAVAITISLIKLRKTPRRSMRRGDSPSGVLPPGRGLGAGVPVR
jgi:hypothetical protein